MVKWQKEKICGIYSIENLITGKIYVGKSENIKERFAKHKNALINNYHYNKHLQRSWNKYGEDNFKFNIVEICSNDILSDKEKFYIKVYKTNDNKYGYNLTNGGEGISGFKHSEETKKYLSEIQTGKIVSEETKQKISKAFKGENNHFFGKKLSDEHKEKMKNSWSYEKHITPERSIKISKTMTGKKRPLEVTQKIAKANCKIIIQITKDFKFIKLWSSATQVEKELGFSRGNISSCCKGRRKSCGDFKWMYKEDYDKLIS